MPDNRRKDKLEIGQFNIRKLSSRRFDFASIKYPNIPTRLLNKFKTHVKYVKRLVANEVAVGNFLTADDISHDVIKTYGGKKKHLSTRQANRLLNGGNHIKVSIPKQYLAKVHLLITKIPHYRYIRGKYKLDQTQFGQRKWQTVVSESGYVKFINSHYQNRTPIEQKMYERYKNESKATILTKLMEVENELRRTNQAIHKTNSYAKVVEYLDTSRRYNETPSKITNNFNKMPEHLKEMACLSSKPVN